MSDYELDEFESFDVPELSGTTPFDAGFTADPSDDLQNVDMDLNKALGNDVGDDAAASSFYYPTDSNVGEHANTSNWNKNSSNNAQPSTAPAADPNAMTEVMRDFKKRTMQEWMARNFGVKIENDDSYDTVETNYTYYQEKRKRQRGTDFIGNAFSTVAHVIESGDSYFEHPIEGVNLESLQMTVDDNIQSGECDEMFDELYTKYRHLIENIPVEAKVAYYFSKSVLKVGWTNRAMAQLESSNAPDDFKRTIRQDPILQQVYVEAMQREIDQTQNGAATRINETIQGNIPGRGLPPPIHTSVRSRPDVEIARGVGPVRAEMQGPSTDNDGRKRHIVLNPNGTENLDELVQAVRKRPKSSKNVERNFDSSI